MKSLAVVKCTIDRWLVVSEACASAESPSARDLLLNWGTRYTSSARFAVLGQVIDDMFQSWACERVDVVWEAPPPPASPDAAAAYLRDQRKIFLRPEYFANSGLEARVAIALVIHEALHALLDQTVNAGMMLTKMQVLEEELAVHSGATKITGSVLRGL